MRVNKSIDLFRGFEDGALMGSFCNIKQENIVSNKLYKNKEPD